MAFAVHFFVYNVVVWQIVQNNREIGGILFLDKLNERWYNDKAVGSDSREKRGIGSKLVRV